MPVKKLLFVLLCMGIGSIHSQVTHLPRATLLKNNVKEVKIYNSDSANKTLTEHWFVDDSGNVIKKLVFYRLHPDKTDTAIEIYTYDALNRMISSYEKLTYDSAHYDLFKSVYFYSTNNKRKITNYRSGGDSSKGTSNIKRKTKKSKKIFKYYYNGILRYKEVWKKDNDLWTIKTHFRRRFLSRNRQTIQLDENSNLISSTNKVIHHRRWGYRYESPGNNKIRHRDKSTRLFTYNNLNLCIKKCTFYKYFTIYDPSCEYYEYIIREY